MAADRERAAQREKLGDEGAKPDETLRKKRDVRSSSSAVVRPASAVRRPTVGGRRGGGMVVSNKGGKQGRGS